MSSPGPPPYNGDDNRSTAILADAILVTIISSVALALRSVTRIWIVRSIGWDDYTIFCATLGVALGTVMVGFEVHNGFGRHRYYLSDEDYIESQRYSYANWIQTFQTLMFTKISICFFLLRIPVEKHFIRPIQGAIIFLVVTNIILTLLWILQCNPVPKAWDKQKSGTCFTNAQLQRIIMSQALISIISDFVLALFPIVLLWKVQIATRIKAGLCFLMGLGLVTAAICVVRTILNWQNVNADPTYLSVTNWHWRAWEVCIGVTAACIPALRPGYRTVVASVASYRSNRSSRKTSHNIPNDLENPSGRSQGQGYSAYAAAAETFSSEADLAQAYGAGEDNFPMQSLPGDKKTADEGLKKVARQGIRKTTEIGVSESTAANPPRRHESLDLGDEEGSLRNIDYF